MRKGGIFMFNSLLGTTLEWAKSIATGIENLLVPILIVACSVGLIYAVVVGIKMMKAEDKSAREENKQRLINIAISIVAIAVLIGLFYVLGGWLEDKSADEISKDIFTEPGATGKSTIGSQLSNTFALVKQCTTMLF